ncbi:cysteine peptidase family C39 domain-containing protein [Pseudobacteriovorax antillogorgiicola]|uniref:Peptidase C39 family protein n=1 Tax=Pseudobacteriovorax antillogorgiicola TaxID=1513793 RepID=A0A1Y6BZZ9_9BACT|nr:cysteine peptidase family C39 domain-containing protein [Pseudobacteriovorax antillogorgiicola]TCS53013.1 peptidase C39-like protein [Pseudobacteriovorax antillogorgiicola]SMF26951.1 Peptidase C39 family protein [Pseudobacteriovorax antillogorgiicola]
MLRFLIFLCLHVFWLSGCSHRSKTLDPELVENSVILPVPFVAQESDYCGPATVAMVAQYFGKSVSQEELAPLMITPSRKGALTIDMYSVSRRLGLNFTRASGLGEITDNLKSENPAIVLLEVGPFFWKKWHYAVVVGVNESRELIYVHSGQDAYDELSYKEFEDLWQRSDRWSLIYHHHHDNEDQEN